MAVLGIILILLGVIGVLGGFWLSTSNGTQLLLNAGPFNMSIAPLTLFIAGMATVLLLWLGLWMITHATKRGIRNRRERKQLLRDQKAQQEELATTQARLRDQRVDNASQRAEARRVEENAAQRETTAYREGTRDGANTAYRENAAYRDGDTYRDGATQAYDDRGNIPPVSGSGR